MALTYKIAACSLSVKTKEQLTALQVACLLIDFELLFFDSCGAFKQAATVNCFDLALIESSHDSTALEQCCVNIKEACPGVPILLLIDAIAYDRVVLAINCGADDCFCLESQSHGAANILLELVPYLVSQKASEFARTIISTIGYKKSKFGADKLADQLTKYDELIGIPNRSYFFELLERAYQISTSWKGGQLSQTPLVLAFIDIERIDHLKESIELAEIDLLYVLLSSRIKEAFYHFDTLARWSENRFALLLENSAGEIILPTIMSKLQGLVSIIEQPFSLINKEVSVACSIGVCLYNDQTSSTEELIHNAEVALSQAKRDGGMCCRFNSLELNRLAMERGVMETSFRRALENEQLELFFQPVVSSVSCSVNGAEALLRWRLENGEWVSPEKIVLLAEELGLMVKLGYWILNRAMSSAKQIQNKTRMPFKIAVNLAPVQLKQTDFISKIEALLKAHRFDAQDLMLEITETQLMDDMPVCISNLKKARALNIGVAIDDFGTGHSSLQYLSQLPISTLKIDRSFVNEIENNDSNVSIITAIVGLAHNLGLNIIAEGVENVAQLTFMRQHLFPDEEIQGYYFSRPLPLDGFFSFIDTSYTHFDAENEILTV